MKGRREIKKESNREQILKAAIELFTTKGFDQTTVENITRKATIAKGTFYNFFEKKEDVLLYFLDKEISKSTLELEKKMGDQKTVADRIELLISIYIKHIFPNREFSKVLMRERVGKIGTGHNKNERNLMQKLWEVIDQAQKNGEIKKSVDAHRMAELIFALYTMYVIYWTNGFIKNKRECVASIRELTHLFLDGVGTGARSAE